MYEEITIEGKNWIHMINKIRLLLLKSVFVVEYWPFCAMKQKKNKRITKNN